MNNDNFQHIQVPGRWTLLKLTYLQIISTHAQNNPTTFNFFDPYTGNVIALDHILTGLCINLLDSRFFELKQFKFVQQLERSLRLSLRNVGLEGELCAYSCRKKNW